MSSCKINFKKAKKLPINPEINTLYFIENGQYAESYLTDNLGVLKKVGNTLMITQLTAGTGDKNYIHDQGIPAIVWTVNHGLNKRPSPVVVDSSGAEVEGEVEHIDDNTLTITFSAIFSGKAYIN
jgi:hypothetical protein